MNKQLKKQAKMSETKNVGNLKNRIDNNLKLEIPKINEKALVTGSHPATAPASNNFGDHRLLKDLISNWNHENISELHNDDYFKRSPSSASSSGFKREKILNTSAEIILRVFLFRTRRFVHAVYWRTGIVDESGSFQLETEPNHAISKRKYESLNENILDI